MWRAAPGGFRSIRGDESRARSDFAPSHTIDRQGHRLVHVEAGRTCMPISPVKCFVNSPPISLHDSPARRAWIGICRLRVRDKLPSDFVPAGATYSH